MKNIQMVDLKGQYAKIKEEVDKSLHECIDATAFINGPQVKSFADNLSTYLGVDHVIPCANGTDALQIAMMALGLERGDEVVVPSFTYVATAEVIGLLGLVPVMVDVDDSSFNISSDSIENAITAKTKAIVPVHLYGQCAQMEAIMNIAQKHGLYVIEDTAQAIGADFTFSNGAVKKAGTIGDIGCTSFFPSKNLGCYGDGGALYTANAELAKKIRMIANHGQEKKYVHKYIGVNSRLDSMQAAILNVKLRYLDNYSMDRRRAADLYDESLSGVEEIVTPFRSDFSTHVFHQYTLRVRNGKRDHLQAFLKDKEIPSMIYYPVPLNEQEAFKSLGRISGNLSNTYALCDEVISLPMHTELKAEEQSYITESIKEFFN